MSLRIKINTPGMFKRREGKSAAGKGFIDYGKHLAIFYIVRRIVEFTDNPARSPADKVLTRLLMDEEVGRKNLKIRSCRLASDASRLKYVYP